MQSNKLKTLMKYGTKFITPSCTNAILKQFTYDLDLYIYELSSSYHKSIAYFNQRRCLVIKQLLKELKQKSSFIVSCNKANLFKHIKILQEQFVITYVDKSPNNYAIICKQSWFLA